jgi:hypothetical protein
MKKWIGVITSLILLITGVAYSKDYEVRKKAANYDVEIKIDKNPPVVGDNNVEIGIKDSSGAYVKDAKVKIDYSMPAMPGMPAMKYKTTAALKDNKYKAVIKPAMSGSWDVLIKITRGGKTTKVKFTIEAQ